MKVSVQHHAEVSYLPRRLTQTPMGYELEWEAEPVWAQTGKRKISTNAGRSF